VKRGLFFALLTAACGGEIEVAELSAPGPHAIGYRTYSVEYLPPLATEPRRTFVLVWYPALPAEGERPFYTLRTSEVAVVDAPPAELGPLPVVVYSHGHQSYGASLSHLAEHLASHGFITIAPTHTGNTFVDGDNRETEIYYQRAFDVKAALDHFAALSNDPLAGRFGERIAMTGHSFGGYTTFALAGATYPIDPLVAACEAGTGKPSFCSTMTAEKAEIFRAGLEEPRFSAAVTVDPADFDLFGAEGVAAIDIPTLHMIADVSTPEDRYWPALHHPDDVRMRLIDGDHNDFIDTCSTGITVRCSTLDPASVWLPMRVYTLAFLRKVLLEEEGLDGILDGKAPVSPLIELTARP
jgi:predicted dienelactone hydrolase